MVGDRVQSVAWMTMMLLEFWCAAAAVAIRRSCAEVL